MDYAYQVWVFGSSHIRGFILSSTSNETTQACLEVPAPPARAARAYVSSQIYIKLMKG